MTVHDDLNSNHRDKYALFVGENAISYLCLEALQKDLQYTIGSTIEITKKPFAVSLKSVSSANGTPSSSISGSLDYLDNEVLLKVFGGLVLDVDIGISGQNNTIKDIFARVKMIVKDISFAIETTSNALTCTPNKAEFIPELTRIPEEEFQVILDRNNLDPTDVARVEGLISLSAIQTLITSALNREHEISLVKLFPGVTLKGQIKTEIFGNTEVSKRTLCIIPADGFDQTPGSACECSDVGDGMGDIDPGTITDNRDTGNTHPAGTITIGLPRVPNPSSVNLGRRANGIGDIGIYFPQSEIINFGSDTYPAVNVRAKDNGFIGWKASATAAFKKSNIRLDQSRGAIVIELTFNVEISGKMHADFGKLGKSTICNFDAEQKRDSELVVAFIPVLNRGEIYFKPVIEKLRCGSFEVEVNIGKLIGSGFGTKGAVIGFIVDEILSHNIEMKLPRKIRKEIGKYMSKNAFKLIDTDEWLEIMPPINTKNRQLYAMHSSLNNTLLVSTLFEG